MTPTPPKTAKTPEPDWQRIRHAFGRAAATYERHDELARELEARLLDSLDYYEGKPARVLDVGCGTARGTAQLKKRWPAADVVAVDLALPMLRAAKRHSGWRRGFARVCADARALPFPDHSFDIVYSNLCLPWCGRPKGFFNEFNRVLTSGGFMVMSSLGPDTLQELKAAWTAADPAHSHVDDFIDMHDIGDDALAAGLKDPVLDTDHITLTYADARSVATALKDAGAVHAGPDRNRALTGKGVFDAMLQAYPAPDGRIAATFEIVTMHAWGPPKDFLPRYGSRETPFEVVKWAERAPRPRR